MDRNKSHLNPMSLLKAEEREEAEVEEEAEEEDRTFRRMTTDKVVREEDNPSEEDGNLEEEVEEEEEDLLTKAQISENPEWPAKLQIKTGVLIAMSQDISTESAQC